MAGPLVSRSGRAISAAMIIASVVLPSPGGPDSSTWSGARPRPLGAPRAPAPSCSRTRSWPIDLVEACGAQRRLDGALVAVGVGGGQRSTGRRRSASRGRRSVESVTASISIGQACSAQERGAQQRRDVGAVGIGLGRHGVDRARRPPWPTSRARPGPARTWSRHASPAAARHRRRRRCRVGAPMRSLSSRMIRWAPFWPMPGTWVSVLTSSVATARAQVVGGVHGQHRLGQLGPDADAVWSSSKRRFSSSSRKPNSVSESSRTTMRGGQGGLVADAQRGERAGVHISSRPTPPTSRTAPSQA